MVCGGSSLTIELPKIRLLGEQLSLSVHDYAHEIIPWMTHINFPQSWPSQPFIEFIRTTSPIGYGFGFQFVSDR